MNILLIHPPQAKAAEPPAGIPLLASTLRQHGCSCTVCDLNAEGLHHLLDTTSPAADTWSKRAFKNRKQHLQALQSVATYSHPDKYKRAVNDLNRVIENSGRAKGVSLSLANYQDPHLSPQKSEDLLYCATNPHENLFYPLFSSRISELIQANEPAYIGISLNYLSQALCSFSIIGFIRKHFPTIKIILGGGLVTTWLQNPGWPDPFGSLIDHWVSGPGELPLLNILRLNSSTHQRCCPDYSDLLDIQYLSPGFILPYATSTGCFWRKCSFCPETSEKNPYAPVNIENALHEITTLIQQTKPTLIHFLDNAVSPAMLKALADRALDIPWYGFVRFTHHLADPEFCKRLRKSGCVMLKLGLESGSQMVLDQMQKGIDLQLVTKALKALQSAGIMTYVYLLFGTPAESLREARETLGYVTRHQQQITYLNLAIFNLPACSPQNEELEIREFYDGDLSIYNDFHHPLGWNRKEIRRFLDNEFKREPAIHTILQNDPFQFTSNHAPLFTSFIK
jgi:hypothetical protein